jgi:hypothetical protein
MAFVEMHTFYDYAVCLNALMDGIPAIFSVVQVALAAEIIANPAWMTTDLTVEEKNEILKRLTGFTVGTNTDLNCYPRGFDTTLCFDLDGEEVP